jgi:LacI family transcriptional regulator
MARALLKTEMPVVNVRRFETTTRLPTVWEDNAQLCRLAVNHFAERHFRKFAYCGWTHIHWSNHREGVFVEAVREAGYGECHVYRPAKKGHRTWEEELEEVGQWLQSLSTPIGLLAANDARGVQVLDACQRIGLPVPEQCAVLGIDNQVIFCEFATPTLSSIDQDEVRNGFEAARLLDGLMAGKKTPAEPIQIPAIGIVPRASTDSIAVEDKELAMAVRYLRAHACDRIGIDDLVSHTCMSRRALQRRFKAAMGCTPLEAKLAIQLQRIQQLLSETDLSLQVIAKRSGFRHSGHMSAFFKQRTGSTPGHYRQQNRGSHLQEHELNPQ